MTAKPHNRKFMNVPAMKTICQALISSTFGCLIFAEAKTLLMKLELVMKQTEIKQLIQRHYGNETPSQESEPAGP